MYSYTYFKYLKGILQKDKQQQRFKVLIQYFQYLCLPCIILAQVLQNQ